LKIDPIPWVILEEKTGLVSEHIDFLMKEAHFRATLDQSDWVRCRLAASRSTALCTKMRTFLGPRVRRVLMEEEMLAVQKAEKAYRSKEANKIIPMPILMHWKLVLRIAFKGRRQQKLSAL
jgi:hypothetical protein